MLENNLSKRRSYYHINNQIPITNEKLISNIQACVWHCPTPFNAQSARVVLLLNDKHEIFWELVDTALFQKISEEKSINARRKIEAFRSGYGTILFFEDADIIKNLQQKYSEYTDSIELWAQQASGMLQYMIWQVLSEENIGASLQHYGNLVENKVNQTFDLPKNWKIIAQMPFGEILESAASKTIEPIEKRVIVLK